MTDESTVPFGVASPWKEEGEDLGELSADAAMLDAPVPNPGPQETVLDARSDDSRRGRTRERTARAGHEANKFPLRAQAIDPTDLASAAAAAEALAAATAHVDLSVDDLRSKEGASPEKKPKLSATTKMPPAPAFGGLRRVCISRSKSWNSRRICCNAASCSSARRVSDSCPTLRLRTPSWIALSSWLVLDMSLAICRWAPAMSLRSARSPSSQEGSASSWKNSGPRV